MKLVTSPVLLILFLLIVIAVGFVSLPLDLVVVMAGMIVGVWQMMRRTQSRRTEQVIGENLKPESQALLKPIRRLAKDMREMVESRPTGSAVSLVGKDVVAESDRVVAQCAASLTARDELKRLLRGKYDAEKEIERVREAISGAISDGERQALESTLSARQTEQGHYSEIEAAIAKIDTGLRQAEAALAEMKARLSLTATATGGMEESTSNLHESLLRVRATTLSVDEAEELING